MPQLDAATFLPQLFWLAVCFGLLYLIMARLALPRVGEALEARRERIESDLERAEALRAEAAETLAVRERRIAEAREEARLLVAEAVRAAAEEAERRHAELAARLDAEATRAEERVASASAAALAEMRGGAAALVRRASLRIAGVEPSDAAVRAALGDA